MENELIPLHSPRLKALDAWLKKTNIKLVQINGQRKYGGPPEGWDGPPPGAHCEVFISNISRDAYEDLLIPLFSLVGPLWEFRLMMNFSGQNRGFAYAKYATAELAASAIRLLDGYAVEPGYRLSVRRSTEKRHLCIHNLPASFQPDDVLRALRLLADGVEDVTLKPEDKGDTRAAIVAFSSHHAASMAKKVIVESKSSPVRSSTVPSGPLRSRQVLHGPVRSSEIPSGPLRSQSRPQSRPHVSTKWLSAVNEVHKPPCQQRPAPPPPGTGPPSGPPPLCGALGGPAVPEGPARPPPEEASPVLLLRRLCQRTGFGEPLYDLRYSHTGSDGFLYFAYSVTIGGVCGAFRGQVTILPGPPTAAVLREAQREAAAQLLQRVQALQLAL
uniref:RRM domain-containing protein n=1 Tax=Salarias fasciatus TaxID=181472 RepID=A0A672FJ92_SALFA